LTSIGASLVPDRADPALREGVRLRCPRRNLDHLDASGGEHSVEGGGELGVPVPDQKPEPVDALVAALHA